MSLTGALNALAALSVSAAGQTPTVYGYANLPAAVKAEMLPCRLIMPFESRNAEAGVTSFVACGGALMEAERKLVDLCLWQPVTHGRYHAANSDLVAYVDAYDNAILASPSLGLSEASVRNYSINITTVEYPAGSGVFYRAVEVMVIVGDYVHV